jgi:hypothetical protein
MARKEGKKERKKDEGSVLERKNGCCKQEHRTTNIRKGRREDWIGLDWIGLEGRKEGRKCYLPIKGRNDGREGRREGGREGSQPDEPPLVSFGEVSKKKKKRKKKKRHRNSKSRREKETDKGGGRRDWDNPSSMTTEGGKTLSSTPWRRPSRDVT